MVPSWQMRTAKVLVRLRMRSLIRTFTAYRIIGYFRTCNDPVETVRMRTLCTCMRVTQLKNSFSFALKWDQSNYNLPETSELYLWTFICQIQYVHEHSHLRSHQNWSLCFSQNKYAQAGPDLRWLCYCNLRYIWLVPVRSGIVPATGQQPL